MKWINIQKKIIQIKMEEYLKSKGYINFDRDGNLLNNENCCYDYKKRG
jgi:hypothetical protein